MPKQVSSTSSRRRLPSHTTAPLVPRRSLFSCVAVGRARGLQARSGCAEGDASSPAFLSEGDELEEPVAPQV